MSKTNGTTAAGRRQPPALGTSEHAKTWHIDDGTAPDGCVRRKTPVRRSFPPASKLSIRSEYAPCSETGEKSGLLRRTGPSSSRIVDRKHQTRQSITQAHPD